MKTKLSERNWKVMTGIDCTERNLLGLFYAPNVFIVE